MAVGGFAALLSRTTWAKRNVQPPTAYWVDADEVLLIESVTSGNTLRTFEVSYRMVNEAGIMKRGRLSFMPTAAATGTNYHVLPLEAGWLLSVQVDAQAAATLVEPSSAYFRVSIAQAGQLGSITTLGTMQRSATLCAGQVFMDQGIAWPPVQQSTDCDRFGFITPLALIGGGAQPNPMVVNIGDLIFPARFLGGGVQLVTGVTVGNRQLAVGWGENAVGSGIQVVSPSLQAASLTWTYNIVAGGPHVVQLNNVVQIGLPADVFIPPSGSSTKRLTVSVIGGVAADTLTAPNPAIFASFMRAKELP